MPDVSNLDTIVVSILWLELILLYNCLTYLENSHLPKLESKEAKPWEWRQPQFLFPSFLKRKKDQGPVYFYLMYTYQTSITEKLDIMQNLTIEYLPWDSYFLSINSRNKILFLNLI